MTQAQQKILLLSRIIKYADSINISTAERETV